MRTPIAIKRYLGISQLKYIREKEVASPSGAKESIIPLTNS